MISVLLPSRKRPDGLKRAVDSLRAHAEMAPEILVATDPDDVRTFEVACDLGVNAHQVSERYGYGQLHRYYNELAELSSGDWLLLFNDDAEMMTPSWDARIEELSGAALVADVRSAHSPEFVCFPAVRRSMYDAMGFYSAATPHVDSFIQDVARALGVVRPVDVFVRHDRPDLTGQEPDSTFVEGRAGLAHHAYFDPTGPVQAEIAAAIGRGSKLL